MVDLEEDSATEDLEEDSETQDLADLENETKKEEISKYSPVDKFLLNLVFL